MVQVYLPLGYPALSGEVAQMLIYQGNIVRLYAVPTDPRTTAQLVQRKLLSDVSKIRGSAGKWAKSAWKLTFGSKWSSVVVQLVQADVGGFWSTAVDEYEGLGTEQKEDWNIAAPYQATYNEPGLIFYALARALWLWDDEEGAHNFYQPNPATEWGNSQLDWWMADLTDLGWQRGYESDGLIDDRDSRWSFSGSWNYWNGAGPRESTMMQGMSVGAWAEISVLAMWGRVAYMRNTDCGEFKVYVDGAEAAIVNAYAVTFDSRYWVDILRPVQLRTYRIVHTGSVGQKVDLDGILLELSYRFVDVDLSTGTWVTVGGLGDYQARMWHSTNTGEASIEFNFVGAYFVMYFIKNSTYGVVDVFVDGEQVDTIDQFAIVESLTNWAVVGRFSYGLHRARLVKAGVGQFNMGTTRILRKMSDFE